MAQKPQRRGTPRVKTRGELKIPIITIRPANTEGTLKQKNKKGRGPGGKKSLEGKQPSRGRLSLHRMWRNYSAPGERGGGEKTRKGNFSQNTAALLLKQRRRN